MSTPRIPWLLECTDRWPRVRAKFLFHNENRPVRDDDGVVTAFRDGQVTLRENRRTDGFTIAILEQGYQGVRVGDLVLHSMDAFAGAIGVSESDGKCTPEYVVVNGDEDRVENRYFAYLLRRMALRDYIRVICPSVRERAPRFRYPRFQEVLLPAPPIATQRAIADFLDRKTAAIDDLIAKKERLLALLAEKRAALIHQAVTKGLDPNVPMKNSGAPWIGDTPAHWDMKLLKFACVLQRGFDLPSQDRTPGAVPVVAGGGISGWHDKAMVNPPCVVTGRYGTVGEVHVIDQPCWPLNTSLYVKEFWGNDPHYIRHLLSAAPMKMYSAKSAVPGVDRNDLHVIPVPMPTVEEQVQIVQEVERRLAHDQRVVDRVGRQIEHLREYRQALITAAVTGQLDVNSINTDDITTKNEINQLGLFGDAR